MKFDILNIIQNEVQNENVTISLIPSENVMSSLATRMYSLKSSNRYILPLNIGDRSYMPGRENLELIVDYLERKLCSIYKCNHVIIKALSGLQQMSIILSSIRNITDKIVILNNLEGGHSKTENIANNNKYKISYINLDFDSWDIDYNKFKKVISKWKQSIVFIYIDHTIVLKPLDINRLLKVIPSNWLVYYDISHLQIFYFSHVYEFPINKNFFYGGSMHKSFPGPQKAIICFNDDFIYNLIETEFMRTIASIHTGSVLALFITVLEMELHGYDYSRDIVLKTQYLANLLSRKLNVIGPKPFFTNTHQICIETKNHTEVTRNLATIGIITTPTRIPSLKNFGLRLGIQELCRLGVKYEDLRILADILISCINDNNIDISLKVKVKILAEKLNLIKYSIDPSIIKFI